MFITLLYLISPTIHLFSIGMTLFISCALYIYITHGQFPTYLNKHLPKKWKLVLDIIFLLLFSLSLAILHFSEYRPPSYFFIYSLCVVSVAISIYFSNQKIDYIVQCIKILLLSFNIKYSIFNLAGIVPGIDSITHARVNYLLAQTGNVSTSVTGTIAHAAYKEVYFPVMHIQTAITGIVTNYQIKYASCFAIIVPFVIMSLFIYLITKYLFGERTGLFALLLFNLGDYNTYWGAAPQTTTYGIALYCFIFYLFVKSYILSTKSKPKWVCLFLVVVFTLILTHAVSSFIFLTTLISLLAGFSIYNYLNNEHLINSDSKQIFGICIITIISLLEVWFTVLVPNNGLSFFGNMLLMLYSNLAGKAQFLNRPEAISVVATTIPPFVERLANTLGFALFLFFGIIGSLYCISNKYRNRYLFSLVFMLSVLFGITFAFPLFGIKTIIPTRWFSFEYLFLSTFASFSILKLISYMRSNKLKTIYLILIFFSISFFMTTDTVSNWDSPLWLKNNTISTTYSSAEIAGAERITNSGANITSDLTFGNGIISGCMNKTFNAYTQNKPMPSGSIFLWRSYMENRPIRGFVSIDNRSIATEEVLGPEFHSKLDKYNKVYNNNKMSGYLI